MVFGGLYVVWTPSPQVTQNSSFTLYVLIQLPSMFCMVMNRAVWLKNPILMRSFIISHFCLCAPSQKKLLCLLSPFQKYNGKPTRTAEVHICSSTLLFFSLPLILCFSESRLQVFSLTRISFPIPSQYKFKQLE